MSDAVNSISQVVAGVKAIPKNPAIQENAEDPNKNKELHKKSDISVIKAPEKVNKRRENIEEMRLERLENLAKPEWEVPAEELPRDLFNYQSHKTLDESAILTITTPEDHVTAEKSNSGKELDAFFSNKKEDRIDYVVEEKHKYIKLKPEDKDSAYQYIKEKKAARAQEDDQFVKDIVAKQDPLSTKRMSEVGDARNARDLEENLQSAKFDVKEDQMAKELRHGAQEEKQIEESSTQNNAPAEDAFAAAQKYAQESSASVKKQDENARHKQADFSSPESSKTEISFEKKEKDGLVTRQDIPNTEKYIRDPSKQPIQESENKSHSLNDEVSEKKKKKAEIDFNLRLKNYIKKRDQYQELREERLHDPDHPDNVMKQKVQAKLKGEKEPEDLLIKELTPNEKMMLKREELKKLQVGQEIDSRTSWYLKGDVRDITNPNFNDKAEVTAEEIFHGREDKKEAQKEFRIELKTKTEFKKQDKIKQDKEISGTEKNSEPEPDKTTLSENNLEKNQEQMLEKREINAEENIQNLARSLDVKV